MKNLHIIITLLLAYSCRLNQPKEVLDMKEQSLPSTFVSKTSDFILVKNDTVFYNNKRFSGFLFQLYPENNDTFSVEGYYNGLLTGSCKKWYPNHQLMEVRDYVRGKKNGQQISFWENGYKRFEFIALNDTYEGELKEWNQQGQLIHLANFSNGQEEGTQKMWYDNGKIRANYVIIKGKRYGLLGTKNCINVSDSIFAVK